MDEKVTVFYADHDWPGVDIKRLFRVVCYFRATGCLGESYTILGLFDYT